MLNVLHLLNYPGKGGSEKYILSLAEKLHGSSCIFHIAYSEDGPMLEQARELGINTFKLPMKSPYDLKAAKMLKGLCREHSIDVIHTHFLREYYISAFSKLMGNRVVIINTNHLITEKNIVLMLTNRILSYAADRVIAVCNTQKQRMVSEGISGNKIHVIHNGVDVSYWKGRRSYKIRKELGIDRKDFLIVSVARFTEEKGHIFLLETIKYLKKLLNAGSKSFQCKMRFLLVGDGELLEESRKLADMLGVSDDVIFAEFRSDVKSILHGCDLYVSHSQSEALSLSILEAMACELPVVATNVGGSSEIIKEDNNCGILVEYGDVEGFACAILRFVKDKDYYKACRDNVLKVVEEEFNLDKTVKETYNLYIKSLTPGNA